MTNFTSNICVRINLTKCLDTSSISDATTVSCPTDQRIVQPGVNQTTSTTTTYTPPTGVPGMTGATGERVSFRVSHFTRQPDVSRNALSFTDEFFLSFFIFYRNTALSSRGKAAHQMYTRGLVIGAATIIDLQISLTPVSYTHLTLPTIYSV